MKVLHIVASLDESAGGPSRSVPQTCEQLAALGIEVVLIARPSQNPVEVTESKNLNVVYKSFVHLVRFASRLKKNDFDLIHLQHIWDPYIHVMAWFARIKGIPYIITPRGMLEPWIMNRNRWKKIPGMFFYQRKDLEKAALIHTTCLREKENIRKLGIANCIEIVSNGIDLAHVPQADKKFGRKKIVFLSRIHPKKGIELLLEAWRNTTQTDWQLEIAGEGNDAYIQKLQTKLRRENIERVCFVGPKYGVEKWRFLNEADLFVLPTYSENFGIAVAEALVMETPAITTTGTPWKELETEHCGWWIDLSVENLVQALNEAFKKTPEDLQSMGSRGKNLIEQRYDIKKVSRKIKELYNKLLIPAKQSSQLKIVHFVADIDQAAGGTTSYMQLLAGELRHYCELIVVCGNSTHPAELTGIRTVFFDLSLYRWWSYERKFLQFLSFEKPDLVHINGIWTPENWVFQKAAQQLGIQVVLSPHGMLEPYILNRHPLKKQLGMQLYQHKAIQRADFLHTTAQSELNQTRYLGYQAPAVVIPNGVDFSEIRPKTQWSKGPVQNILFLSRVHPKKGIELLIDAIALLKQNHLKITIAGEGDADYVAHLKQHCKEMDVDHLFDFAGGVYGDKKWELYRQADLFVLPTYSENFGIVIAEALATGLPVITTTGTPWHELETEQCGWWIELSVENLAKSLTKAIQTKPEQLQEMGIRGRKLVEERYDIKAIARKMKAFYDRILLGSQKPESISE